MPHSLQSCALRPRSGELLRRCRQACSTSQLAYHVVAAELTPSRRDLLLFCQVRDQQVHTDDVCTITVQVGASTVLVLC